MSNPVRAKKALGQHFLTDMNIARRIADTIAPAQLPEGWALLPVLEVGPGTGVLTSFLLEDHKEVRAVELDAESVAYLAKVYPQLPVIEADFLKLDLAEVYAGEFLLIGNYPYNISSQIFFKLLDNRERIPVCSGMLQREVAERLAAREGTKARGILSVLLQAWYDVEYLFTVSEHVFNPPPKVKSGVIIMRRNDVRSLGCDEALFRTVVKTTFGQRRKTLRNSLRGLLPAGAQLPDTAMMGLRPEQLSVAQFIELTNLVNELRKA